MRLRRLTCALLLAAVAAPGLWLRSPLESTPPNRLRELAFAPVSGRTPTGWPAGLELVGAWHLTSRNNRFGGYSALLPDSGGSLLAISDTGNSLRFSPPGAVPTTPPEFGQVGWATHREPFRDIEAATQDPKQRMRWFAYEGRNEIRRFGPGDRIGVAVHPAAMDDWYENGGPEGMVRLTDGRFLVLSEVAPWLSDGTRPALLFPSDPVAGATPIMFSFKPPIGYDPSDMAALPDGRVVILLRELDVPFAPPFKGMLVLADPARIVAGEPWPWHKLAELDDPLPRENYEGLAIVPDASGVTLWLVSDDNFASFQRTLLLELHWQVTPRPQAAGPEEVRPRRSPS